MSGQESTSTSASASEAPAVPTDPLQHVYDAYFTDISNNDNLDAYRLYEYKRCIDYIKKNKKSTKLLDNMKTEVLAILNTSDRNKNLPIDTELKKKLSDIQSLETSTYSDAKSFLKDYIPDDLMITIKPGNDKFIPIIDKAANDNDFAKQFVLLGTSTDDYEIKIMKVDSETISAT